MNDKLPRINLHSAVTHYAGMLSPDLIWGICTGMGAIAIAMAGGVSLITLS